MDSPQFPPSPHRPLQTHCGYLKILLSFLIGGLTIMQQIRNAATTNTSTITATTTTGFTVNEDTTTNTTYLSNGNLRNEYGFNMELPKPLMMLANRKSSTAMPSMDNLATTATSAVMPKRQKRAFSHRPTLMDVALQASAREGLQAMTELYRQIVPNIVRNGNLLEDNHPAALLSKFSESQSETLQQEMAAYATISAAKAFRKNYKYFNELARQAHTSKISLRHTALEGLCPPRDPPTCMPASARYRTHDGTCNSKRRPRWGAAQMPFNRFLPPEYGDGVDSVRMSVDGGPLASSRFVSLLVHGAREGEAPVTLMTAQWGQLLDHDMTSTAQPRSINGSVPSCCGKTDFHPSCFPIKVPLDDPWLAPLKVRCLEFLRSAAAQRRDCILSWREQTNQATSYIDASPIYSNSVKSSDNARVFRNGLLVFGRGNPTEDVCQRGAIATHCIRAGDGRSGEQPGLLALHHVWVGEHNRIAMELSEMNLHWSDEKIYQETRRIVGAMFQHITYREFLPIVLGREVCKLFDLELMSSGFYEGYDPKTNPTVANSFAAAAFRFGHSLVQNSYMRCDRFHNFMRNNVSLHEEFQRGDIGSPGSLHRLLRGLVNQRALKRDEFITPELTNHLFQTPGFPFGLDLAAINIQRGRDHGVPPYTSWRVPCGLTPINSWEEFANVVGPQSAHRISHAYRSVHDIDLFVGGIAERPVVGGLVGPTFACIIAQQFSNSRKGDRFWYENGGFENSFTPAQLNSIRQVSLAQVLCRSVGGGTMQPHVFLPIDVEGNERQVCGTGALTSLDLSPWIEHDPFAHNEQTTPTATQTQQEPDRVFNILTAEKIQEALSGSGTPNQVVKENKAGFSNRLRPNDNKNSVAGNNGFVQNIQVPGEIIRINDKLDLRQKVTSPVKRPTVTAKPIKGISNKIDQNPTKITLNIRGVTIRRPQDTRQTTEVVNNLPVELRTAVTDGSERNKVTKTNNETMRDDVKLIGKRDETATERLNLDKKEARIDDTEGGDGLLQNELLNIEKDTDKKFNGQLEENGIENNMTHTRISTKEPFELKNVTEEDTVKLNSTKDVNDIRKQITVKQSISSQQDIEIHKKITTRNEVETKGAHKENSYTNEGVTTHKRKILQETMTKPILAKYQRNATKEDIRETDIKRKSEIEFEERHEDLMQNTEKIVIQTKTGTESEGEQLIRNRNETQTKKSEEPKTNIDEIHLDQAILTGRNKQNKKRATNENNSTKELILNADTTRADKELTINGNHHDIHKLRTQLGPDSNNSEMKTKLIDESQMATLTINRNNHGIHELQRELAPDSNNSEMKTKLIDETQMTTLEFLKEHTRQKQLTSKESWTEESNDGKSVPNTKRPKTEEDDEKDKEINTSKHRDTKPTFTDSKLITKRTETEDTSEANTKISATDLTESFTISFNSKLSEKRSRTEKNDNNGIEINTGELKESMINTSNTRLTKITHTENVAYETEPDEIYTTFEAKQTTERAKYKEPVDIKEVVAETEPAANYTTFETQQTTKDINPLTQVQKLEEQKRLKRRRTDENNRKLLVIKAATLKNDTKSILYTRTTTASNSAKRLTTVTTVKNLTTHSTNRPIELRQYQTPPTFYTTPQKVVVNGPNSDQYEIEINIRQTNKQSPSPELLAVSAATNPYTKYPTTYKTFGDYDRYSNNYKGTYYPNTPTVVGNNIQTRRTKPPTIIYVNEHEDRYPRITTTKTTRIPGIFQNIITFASSGFGNPNKQPQQQQTQLQQQSSPHSTTNIQKERPIYGQSSLNAYAPNPVSTSISHYAPRPGAQTQAQALPTYPAVPSAVSLSQVGGVVSSGGGGAGVVQASSTAISNGNFGTISGVAQANGADSTFSFNIRPKPSGLGQPSQLPLPISQIESGGYGLLSTPHNSYGELPSPGFGSLANSGGVSSAHGHFGSAHKPSSNSPFSSENKRPQQDAAYYGYYGNKQQLPLQKKTELDGFDVREDYDEFIIGRTLEPLKSKVSMSQESIRDGTESTNNKTLSQQTNNKNDENYNEADDESDYDDDYTDDDSDISENQNRNRYKDRDGYVRPEHVIKTLLKSKENELKNLTNFKNCTVEPLDDNYVLPILNNATTMESEKSGDPDTNEEWTITRTPRTPTTPTEEPATVTTENVTNYPDIMEKHFNNDILAIDYEDALTETPLPTLESIQHPSNLLETHHSKKETREQEDHAEEVEAVFGAEVAFAPIKILNKLERPDNWLIYDVLKNYTRLPELPAIHEEQDAATPTNEIPKPFQGLTSIWLNKLKKDKDRNKEQFLVADKP